MKLSGIWVFLQICLIYTNPVHNDDKSYHHSTFEIVNKSCKLSQQSLICDMEKCLGNSRPSFHNFFQRKFSNRLPIISGNEDEVPLFLL